MSEQAEAQQEDCRAGPIQLAVTGDAVESGDRPLHVMRLGPIHDTHDGYKVLELDEPGAIELARATQEMIDAGTPVPISREHEIEREQYGEKFAAAPVSFGRITRVFYEDGGIYADREWTAAGVEFVGQHVIQGDGGDGRLTSLMVSPRVNFGPVSHPKTGDQVSMLGWIDVISLTHLPRTSGLTGVSLSAPAVEPASVSGEAPLVTVEDDEKKNASPGFQTDPAPTTLTTTPANILAGPDGDSQMSDPNEPILFARTAPGQRIVEMLGLAATGIETDAELVDAVQQFVEANSAELDELGNLRAKQAADALAAKGIAADEAVKAIEDDGMRGIVRAGLMSTDAAVAAQAQKFIEDLAAPDHSAGVIAAVEEAKTRGAIPADYEAPVIETAEQAAGAVAALSALPAGNTITLARPEGAETNEEADAGHVDEDPLDAVKRRADSDGVPMAVALRRLRSEDPQLFTTNQTQELGR